MFCIQVQVAYPKEIILDEKQCYQFVDGQYKGKNPAQNMVYNWDEDKNILTEKENPDTVLRIINKGKNMVCVRARFQGIESLSLRDDGTYYFSMTTYIDSPYGEIKAGTSFALFSYGIYRIVENE